MTMTRASLPFAIVLFATAPLSHAGLAVRSEASPIPNRTACPSPSADELDIATDRVRWLLEESVRAPWRSDLGLVGATRADAVALVGSEHGAVCNALYAVAPFDGDAPEHPYLYYRVRDVYLVVPAYRYLGEGLVIAFKATISYETMHLSSF